MPVVLGSCRILDGDICASCGGGGSYTLATGGQGCGCGGRTLDISKCRRGSSNGPMPSAPAAATKPSILWPGTTAAPVYTNSRTRATSSCPMSCRMIVTLSAGPGWPRNMVCNGHEIYDVIVMYYNTDD